jgi:hypothetical protein
MGSSMLRSALEDKELLLDLDYDVVWATNKGVTFVGLGSYLNLGVRFNIFLYCLF